jgi:hypothetical protein
MPVEPVAGRASACIRARTGAPVSSKTWAFGREVHPVQPAEVPE